MEKRMVMRLPDDERVAAMKTAADEQRVPIVQWVMEAIQQRLTGGSASSADSLWRQEIRERNRERYRRKRAAAGKPVPLAKTAPFRKSGELLQRTCPLCDTVFTAPIKAQHQKYCTKRCTRYAFNYNHDMAKARPAFAAFMLRSQRGSKR